MVPIVLAHEGQFINLSNLAGAVAHGRSLRVDFCDGTHAALQGDDYEPAIYLFNNLTRLCKRALDENRVITLAWVKDAMTAHHDHHEGAQA